MSKMKELQKLLDEKNSDMSDGMQVCRDVDDNDYDDDVVDEQDEGAAEAAGREEP